MMIRFGSAPRRRLGWRDRRRSAAKRSCARATIARSAGSVGIPSAAGAKPLRRVAKVLDRRRRRLATLELLALAVDPDHRDIHLQARRNVGLVAARYVEPALLAADSAGALLEVSRIRLVAADLLGGHDDVEPGAKVAPRDAEQLVVDVGDDPHLVPLAEPVHRRVRLAERKPLRNAVGQELGAGWLELPADLLCGLHRGAAQDLGIQLVRAADDLPFDLEEAVQELLLVEAEAVPVGLPAKRLEDSLLPIDQGAVAIRGHPCDVFELREGHEPRDYAKRHLSASVPARSDSLPRRWISSSTRASSSSPSMASPSRKGGRRTPCRRPQTPLRSLAIRS